MNILVPALSLLFVAGVHPSPSKAAHFSDGILPGGYEPLDPAGEKAAAVGVAAADLLSDSRTALHLLKLVKVKDVKVKVQNGFLYRLTLVVGATSCAREEEEEEYEAALKRCSETGDDQVWGTNSVCHVDVLLRPKNNAGKPGKEERREEGDEKKEGEEEEEGGKKKGGKEEGEKPEVEMEAIMTRGNFDDSCYYDWD